MSNLSVVVAIATRGRPDVLSRVVSQLAHQSYAPSQIIISCCDVKDAGAAVDLPLVRVVTAEPGLTRQRNAAIRILPPDADVLVFFDDDFVPHRQWLEQVVQAFAQRPELAGLTGRVIADGITTEGISFDSAVELVERASIDPTPEIEAPYSPYGCNMAYRVRAISGLKFDERLPLYGWQEDRDFGAEVARRGSVGRISTAIGVHMGVKSGRVSGLKFGYSQVCNPTYLVRKGNMSSLSAMRHIGGNLLKNLVRSPFPEKTVDRYGRLVGNMMALKDVLRGKITPERILDL